MINKKIILKSITSSWYSIIAICQNGIHKTHVNYCKGLHLPNYRVESGKYSHKKIIKGSFHNYYNLLNQWQWCGLAPHVGLDFRMTGKSLLKRELTVAGKISRDLESPPVFLMIWLDISFENKASLSFENDLKCLTPHLNWSTPKDSKVSCSFTSWERC